MLTILGLVFVIVAIVYTYKSAKENGRNAVLWALLAFAVGFGIQFVIPFLLGVVVSVVMIAQEREVYEIQQSLVTHGQVIGLLFLAASVVGVWLVLRKASQLRDDEPLAAPPPPPDFSAGE